MAEAYEYRSAGRSTLTVSGFSMMLAAVLISARDGAGWVIWALWALATLALAHHLLTCQVAGIRLDGARWTVFTDRRRTSFALDRIGHATLTPGQGCLCACTLHLTDGTAVRLPARCLPPAATLAKALRRHGIRVVIDRDLPTDRTRPRIFGENSSPPEPAPPEPRPMPPAHP